VRKIGFVIKGFSSIACDGGGLEQLSEQTGWVKSMKIKIDSKIKKTQT
jgi:hypothetical protein